MAYSGVATLGFIGTNSNKVFEQEDWTRIPVLAGQIINAVDEASNLNTKLAGKTCKLVTNCENMAKTDKLFGSVFNAGKFIKNNINPLIVASSATKVALSKKEDREKVLVTEVGTISGMFLSEGFMKKHLDKFLNVLPVSKKILPVIKGIIFLSASLTGSSIGHKLGKKVAEIWDTPLDSEIRMHKAIQDREKALKKQEVLKVKA